MFDNPVANLTLLLWELAVGHPVHLPWYFEINLQHSLVPQRFLKIDKTEETFCINIPEVVITDLLTISKNCSFYEQEVIFWWDNERAVLKWQNAKYICEEERSSNHLY